MNEQYPAPPDKLGMYQFGLGCLLVAVTVALFSAAAMCFYFIDLLTFMTVLLVCGITALVGLVTMWASNKGLSS